MTIENFRLDSKGEARKSILDPEVAMRFKGGICAMRFGNLIQLILSQTYCFRYSIHLSVTKIYRDLRHYYWWSEIKMDIVDFVFRYLHSQHMNSKYLKPGGFLQRLPILEWRREQIIIVLWLVYHTILDVLITFGSSLISSPCLPLCTYLIFQ